MHKVKCIELKHTEIIFKLCHSIFFNIKNDINYYTKIIVIEIIIQNYYHINYYTKRVNK